MTGVSIVATLTETGAIVAPGADDMLTPEATAVAIGTRDGIERLRTRLRSPES